jgi:O-antigen/teichoic acid export membrane protein
MELVVLTVIPMAILPAAQAVLQAQRRAVAHLSTTVTSTAGSQALGVGLMLVAGRSVDNYLIGVFVGTLTATILSVFLAAPLVIDLRHVQTVVSALRVGLPTVPHNLAQFIIAAGDRVVIERLMGLEAVGRYQAAYSIGILGVALVSAISIAWAPMVYGAEPTERWSLLADTADVLYRLAAIFTGVIAIGAPLVLLIAVPTSYDPKSLVLVSAVVAASTVPYVGVYANVNALLQRRRAGILAWTTPLTATVNIVLNFALVPLIGLAGSALATFLAYSLHAGILQWQTHRMISIPWRYAELRWSAVLAGTAVVAGGLLPSVGIWFFLRLVGASLFAGLLIRTGWKSATQRTDEH